MSANFGRRELPVRFPGRRGFFHVGEVMRGIQIGACIISSVMDKNQDFIHSDSCNSKERGQLSWTCLRRALAAGGMNYVTELLGRRHRLILTWSNESKICRFGKSRIPVPKSHQLNLAPVDSVYRNCFAVAGKEQLILCELEI